MYSKDFKNLALKLYQNLKSFRKVSKIINTSHSTVYRWLTTSIKPRKEIYKKLQRPDIIDALILYISSNPFCSIQDVKKMVSENFKINASNELIRLCILKNNFTKKRARYFSKPKNDEEKLASFLNQRKTYVDEGRNFISIDETSFGRNYLPAIGYAKKGERFYVKRPYLSIKTCSVVAAVSINNPVVFFKKPGSFNTDTYCEFLETLDLPPKTVLLMDNVRFHHSHKVKHLVTLRKWDILYVPPYSPIFNPIEGVFSIVKRHYQKNLNINDAFLAVTDQHIESFFRYSFSATSRF
jgi:transposase